MKTEIDEIKMNLRTKCLSVRLKVLVSMVNGISFL